MIVHTVKNQQQHLDFHITPEAWDKVQNHNDTLAMLTQSEVVYDHLLRRFIKSRAGNVEKLNAMLVVARTDPDHQMRSLVNDYA